jgi:hypothetical protein
MFEHLKWYANLVHCQFDHPNFLPKVRMHELIMGDFILYHGHKMNNKAIQSCTLSEYNHIAIYFGYGLVGHAILDGVKEQFLMDTWEKSDKFLHVYRYHAWTGIPLTDADRKKIVKHARTYIGKRYATETLIMLGLLTQLRGKSTFIGRKLADESFDALNNAFADGKEPLICSEYGYRSFDESGFPIRILPEGLHEEYFNTKNPMIQAFKAQKYNEFHINPNFVTPHDLVMSPDIEFVGNLVKEN